MAGTVFTTEHVDYTVECLCGVIFRGVQLDKKAWSALVEHFSSFVYSLVLLVNLRFYVKKESNVTHLQQKCHGLVTLLTRHVLGI